MKSPFPGMDPYLESHWGDVHTSLMVYASKQLNEQLPGDLQARVEESLSAQQDEDDERTERHLEISDLSDGGRVVTAIEVLSLVDKLSADGQVAYTRKQKEYLNAGINLVEIDLIRAGNFVLAVPHRRLPVSCRTPYLVCMRRAMRSKLRERLPNIRIPLRPSDKDVVLQLQPLLDACYRDGRYNRLNYRLDPSPRLAQADMQWLDEILRSKGLR